MNGGEEVSVVVVVVVVGKGNYGYNVVMGEYVDMVEVGVVDLIKVMCIVL